jgi:hypothetical protein
VQLDEKHDTLAVLSVERQLCKINRKFSSHTIKQEIKSFNHYRVIARSGNLEHRQKEFDKRLKMLLLWLLLIAIGGQVSGRFQAFDFISASRANHQEGSVLVIALLDDGHPMIQTEFDSFGRFAAALALVSLTHDRLPTYNGCGCGGTLNY